MSGKRVEMPPKRKRMRYEAGSESDDDGSNDSRPSKSSSRKRTPSPALGNVETKGTEVDYGDFLIDRTESVEMINLEEGETVDEPLEASSSTKQSSEWFAQMVTSMLSPVETTTPSNTVQKKRYAPECFNCGGEHVLGKCTEPRDFRRIREAQDALRSRRREKPESRYHNPENGDSQQFKPGRISTALREALGIGPDDIPEWIYRMRRKGFVDGYPPGHLKKAILKADNTILKFHTIDGAHENGLPWLYVKQACLFLGEKSDEEDSVPPTIDKDAMIKFLGFNATYKNLRDEERNFRVPPFDTFCEFHEKRLIDNHGKQMEQKREERKREKKKAKRRREAIENDGDIILLAPPKPPTFDQNMADCVILNDSKSSSDSVICLDSSLVSNNPPPTPGSSTSILVGTPVMDRRRKLVDGSDAISEAPALDAFSKGIIPFEAREEPTPNRGFMKKMLQKIKDILPGK